jgi:hypothetical protein
LVPIRVQSVGGMTQLNSLTQDGTGSTMKVSVIDANTWEIYDLNDQPLDTTSFSTYTSGGNTIHGNQNPPWAKWYPVEDTPPWA